MNALDEKVLSKNAEIHKLQMNNSSRYSESKLELESLQNTVKDQELKLRKKDSEIRGILDTQMKASSDKKKDNALIEQKVELQEREISML